MAKYLPIDFLGKKDDEPSMAEKWIERTKRMLRQIYCTPEENLDCVTSLLQVRLTSGGFPLLGLHHWKVLHGSSSWRNSGSNMWVVSI